MTFSHEKDKYYTGMTNESWFIYDNYLTVKDWSPNIHPEGDIIEEVVWIRIVGLPIGYFDVMVLSFIGNRVGKSVRVDKNTIQHE